jgi:hypothetical protein
MAVVPNFSAILVLGSCAKGTSCPWWTTDAGRPREYRALPQIAPFATAFTSLPVAQQEVERNVAHQRRNCVVVMRQDG